MCKLDKNEWYLCISVWHYIASQPLLYLLLGTILPYLSPLPLPRSPPTPSYHHSIFSPASPDTWHTWPWPCHVSSVSTWPGQPLCFSCCDVVWRDLLPCGGVWCRILDTGTRTFIVNIWVILITTSLAIWDHSLIISLLWMECNKHELNMNIIMSSLSKSNIKIIFLVAELFVVSDPKKVMFILIFTKIIQD